jgi:hypothetical protein
MWRLPLVRFRVCSISSSIGNYWIDILRPGGALRWKVETVVGKVREWYVESWHFQGCSPRLCRLRTNGLTHTIKYWMYGSHTDNMDPVSIVADRQQKVGFIPTTSLVDSGEKLGMDPRIDQPACCGLCREPFFSGAVVLLNSIDDYVKVCYALIAWDTYDLGPYMDWAWDVYGVLVRFPLQGVHRFESP